MPAITAVKEPLPQSLRTFTMISVVLGAIPVISAPLTPATWVAVQVPWPLPSSMVPVSAGQPATALGMNDLESARSKLAPTSSCVVRRPVSSTATRTLGDPRVSSQARGTCIRARSHWSGQDASVVAHPLSARTRSRSSTATGCSSSGTRSTPSGATPITPLIVLRSAGLVVRTTSTPAALRSAATLCPRPSTSVRLACPGEP